ncbi:MAG TPA: hypothetical protein VGC57_04340, partial [Cellulomonas sp.]
MFTSTSTSGTAVRTPGHALVGGDVAGRGEKQVDAGRRHEPGDRVVHRPGGTAVHRGSGPGPGQAGGDGEP